MFSMILDISLFRKYLKFKNVFQIAGPTGRLEALGKEAVAMLCSLVMCMHFEYC